MVDEEGSTRVEDLVVAAVVDLVVEKVRQQLLLMKFFPNFSSTFFSSLFFFQL